MKDKTTAALFAFFLGGIGVHKFYLGKVGQGIIYLLFSWTFIPIIIGVIEFIILITMPDEKFNLKYNTQKRNTPNTRRQNQQNISSNDLVSTSYKKTGNNSTEMTISLNEENLASYIQQQQQERKNEIKNFQYEPEIIQRQAVQLLESINILLNTKNIDTLKGRYEFINGMYDNFIKASHNRRYISDIQRSIDEYKRMYYDKILNDFELQLLVKPDYQNLKLYYSKCIYETFIKYSEEQKQQIGQLKRESAKEKRKEKIAEVGNEALFELDKLEIDDNKHQQRIDLIKKSIEKLPQNNKTKSLNQNVKLTDFKEGFVINPKSNFELTLYNSSQNILNKIKKIIRDENIWNKEKELLPIFAEYNTKCKEIEEYIQRYKPAYQSTIEELKANSDEYKNASEMDRADIEQEFQEQALENIYERANCDLITLFSGNDIDITIDDDLIKEYSFETISKYFRFKQNKIYVDWERKDFEDLIKAGLAEDAKNIQIEEILKTQPLKVLNKICEKEVEHFKRKNKAIDYLNENPELKNNIGKHIATRKIFKIRPLPDKYNSIDYDQITNQWNYLKEYIRVLVDTYRASERYTADINEDNSWIKEFRVDIFEDLNSNFVCKCAREHKNKKYPKSNPPKLPFHVGCNCDLRKEI